MILSPLALDLANQLIAERRARAALDALADEAAPLRATGPRTTSVRESTSLRERWIPRWNWR